MDALPNSVTFDDVEPQRFLPDKARAALASACEIVLERPGDFADALAWLNAGYSEAAMLDRELKDSERIYKLNLWDLRYSRDRCDTLPRRMALRAGNPKLAESRRLALLVKYRSVRELEHIAPEFIVDLSKHPEKVRDWVVQLTISTARFRGMRLRGGEVIISNDRREDDAVIDAANVEAAWHSMDEKCRQSIQRLKAERLERNADARKRVKDRGWRLRCAVRDVLEAGLPAGKEERKHARRAVLLASLLSYQHELPLSGEFGSWQWNSEGSIYATLAGGTYVPGRESALFNPTHRHDEPFDAGCLNVDGFDGYADLVGRAVRILRRSNQADPSVPVMSPSAEKIMVIEDFRRLCAYMTAMITLQIPADVRALAKAEHEEGHGVSEEWMLWRETRVLAERCITNLAEIRRALDGRGTLTTDRVGKLDGAQEALSDLIGSISNPQLPSWTSAPQHSGRPAESAMEKFNNDMAAMFDKSRVTITRFTDWVNSASSELTPTNPKSKAGAAFMAAMESDPKAKAAWDRTRARMQTFVETMRHLVNSPEYKEAKEDERERWQELADALQENAQATGKELEARHFARPESIEDWEHLARIVEIPDETLRKGNITAREIFACALAWADRQKIKAKLSAQPEQSELELVRAFIGELDAYAAIDSGHRQFTQRYCPSLPGMAGVLRDIDPASFFATNNHFHQQRNALWGRVAEHIPELKKLAARYGVGAGVFALLGPHKPTDIAHARATALQLADAICGAEAQQQKTAPVQSEAAPPSSKPPAPTAPASSQPASPAINGKPAMSKKAKALAALADHPDWTDEQIAQAAGCHVKSLYRWKEFVRARELLREGRGDVMRGLKDGKTGDVEAWDDDESDDDDE